MSFGCVSLSGGVYVMQKNILKLYGGELICLHCGDPIRVGHLVFSRRSNTRKIYHKACWDSLFVDV